MTQIEAPIQEPEEADDPPPLFPADDHHDPLHDIDGKKTILAVGGTLLTVVGLCWVMSHLFFFMTAVERKAKIGDRPTIELDQIRAAAEDELDGKVIERGSMTIEQAMAGYLANPTWRPK